MQSISQRLKSKIPTPSGRLVIAVTVFVSLMQCGTNAMAQCKNKVFSFNSINWTSVSPIRIMGMTVYKSGGNGGNSSNSGTGSAGTGAIGTGGTSGGSLTQNKDQKKDDNIGTSSGKRYSNKTFCECPWVLPPYRRYGVEFEMWEPAMWDDIGVDDKCATLFGKGIGGSSTRFGNVASESSTGGANETFYNAMHWRFMPMVLLSLLLDASCLEFDGFDLAYMSAWDPGWNNDKKSAWMFPEAAIFADNPIVTSAINVASSIVALAGMAPQDYLFMVQGTQGSVYPPTGTTAEPNSLMAAVGDSHKLRYKMSREGLVCDVGLWDCFCVPSPILVQSNYRIAQVVPYQSMKAMFVGSPDWKGMGKNPPLGTAGDSSGIGSAANRPDNFGFLVWRYRKCCMF